MEKRIQRTGFSTILFVPLGLTLVLLAYLLAGGQDRLMPDYGFPEPAFGCNFEDIGVITTIDPPELSRGYRQSELLWCYPPQYFPLYALAILGVVMCGWALVIIRSRVFRHQPIRKEDFLNSMGALIASPLMILLGVRVFKLEISLGFGGGVSRPPDIFNILSVSLIIMGLFVISYVVVSVLVAELKGSHIG